MENSTVIQSQPLVGKIDLGSRNNAYHRIKVYEIIDMLNELDRDVYTLVHSDDIRAKFKRIKKKLNES